MIKLGALLHIMLPEAGVTNVNPMKFADTGIRETLRKFYVFGGMKGRIVCKIAGGAKMFEMKGQGGFGNIGERNIQSVKKSTQTGRNPYYRRRYRSELCKNDAYGFK